MALTQVKLAAMSANSVDSDQYVDGSIDNAHLADGAVDSAKLGNNITLGGTLTVGVDDTGHDVKFFGASSGRYWEWDESADKMIVNGQIDAYNQYNIKPGGEFFKFENTSAWRLTYDHATSANNWHYAIEANKNYTRIYGGEPTSGDYWSLSATSSGVDIQGDLSVTGSIVLEGATADAHETTLAVTDPTADRTITLPNATGTLPVLAVASNTQITSTPEELNYVDGVTSNIQTQLDGKASSKITQNTQGSTYTLVAADNGKHILASGTVTVPDSVFAAGDAVTIVNNTASDLTITKTITTMYMSTDGTSANRTLATRGMATILFASGTVAYISGAGLS